MLAMTMFTACGDDDEPENKQTYTSTINNRAISGEDVVFSQGTAKVELNFSDMTILFSCDYKDINGQSHTFTTPEMALKLKAHSSTVYQFSQSMGETGSFDGYIDLSNGMMWYTFMDGTTKMVCTTHLLYTTTETQITNPENGNTYTHSQSAYLFALGSSGETCVMRIGNFVTNTNGAVDATEIEYDGLHVTPTATGYVITADEAVSSLSGYYKITAVNITVNNQCNAFSGTFTCSGKEIQVSGTLF